MSEDLIFHILEIEKTKDETLIKNAYRMKLASTNPEEKPEEFKRLRTAYEEALAYARKTEEEDEEDSMITAEELDSPAARWIQKVNEVYSSIKRRLDENEWRELLSDDICSDLEYSEEIQKRLFSFLMENYQLTSRIFQILDEKFSIEENENELKEYLPEGFVNFMIGRIHDKKAELEFAFEWLEGDEYADYDTFIRLQYNLEEQVFQKDFTTAKQTIEEMETLHIYHPFLELEKASMASQEGNCTEAADIARRLIQDYPDSLRIPCIGAEMIWKSGEHDEAAEIFASIEEKEEFAVVEKYLAYYAYEKGNQREAEDYVAKVLRQNYQEEEFLEFVNRLDKERIELAKKKTPENADEAKRYVIACIRTENYKIGLEFLKNSRFLEELIGGYGYLCHFYLKEEKWKKARESAVTWRERLSEKKDEEDINKKVAQSWNYQAEAAYGMAKIPKEEEIPEEKKQALLKERAYWLREAEQALREAIAYHEQDMFVQLHTFLLDVQMDAETYEAAKKTADEILDVYPNFFMVLSKKQKICYELREAQEVIDIFYQAQDIYLNFEGRDILEEYIAGFYDLATAVFIHYQQYEDAANILKQAEQAEVESPVLKLYKVRLMRLKAWSDISVYQSDKEAEKILAEFLEQKVEDSLLADLYYEMALIEDKQYYQPWVHEGKAKEYICKAIELNQDPNYYYVYGNILFQDKEYKEALKQYEETERIGGATENLYINMGRCYDELDILDRAIWYFTEAGKMDPENDRVNGYLGSVYTRLMEHGQSRECGELAIKYTTLQIERKGDNPFEYMDRCQVYLDMNRYDEALADADSALKIDKNNCFALSFKAKAYLGKKQYQKALYFIKKAIAAMKSPNEILEFYQTAGDCCRYMRDFKQAEEFYRKGLKYAMVKRPGTEDEYYSSLVSLYKASGDYKKASETIQQRYKVSRSSGSYYGQNEWRYRLDLLRLDLACFSGDKKQVNEYIAVAKKILADSKENSTVMQQLGDIYLFYDNNRRKAVKAYESAYLLAEEEDSLEWNKEILLSLMLFYKEDNNKKLLAKYRKIFLELLCEKYDTRDRALAEKKYTEALYDTMQNLFEMGKYWLCMGNIEKAKQYCEKMEGENLCAYCVKMGCTDYYELKGMIYEEEQNLHEALKCYEMAVQLDRFNGYSSWKVRSLKKKL